MMKNKRLLPVMIVAVALSLCMMSCGGSEKPKAVSNAPTVKVDVGDKPLNLSVYLDLSDRITKGTDGMKQIEKDTAIVNHLVDVFYSSVVNKKEREIVDRMKIFFYPAPEIAAVNSLAKTLDVDLDRENDKLNVLTSMKSKFQSALGKIYDSAEQDGKFLGSDLWGFFTERVKVQCIKKDYRNVLVILTDGYVYHDDNIIKGESCSYISSTTLRDGVPLLVSENGLEDLEVLVLEANPVPNTDFPKMKKVLEDWFKGMGIEKCNVSKTDTPNNTTQVIDVFLGE